MKKIRIGVLGGYRGTSMINYCVSADKAEVVAICDKNPEVIAIQKKHHEGLPIAYYDNFEDFIHHDMDAVVLANYANQHAPFAIKALKKGLHVFSEVLPCQTMAEAVQLIETVEETGKIYAYGENYCYMPGPREMKRLYAQGKMGEAEYAEGEYGHNCESIWPSITYGEKDHWRNNQYATFYCTHSLGPLVHITGLRPVSVVGLESGKTERKLRVGNKSGLFGIEMVTMENGAIFKSIHGWLYKNSVWYSMYGSKGRVETAREGTNAGDVSRVYLNLDEESGVYGNPKEESYMAPSDIKSQDFGHGGSDYYCMDEFVKKIMGEEADTIDVYEAMDMFLPGLFAYRSILNGGVPMQIPNLRNREEREAFRHDNACTDPAVAGDQLIPTFSKGDPEIPDEVYDRMLKLWRKELAGSGSTGYLEAATTQGEKKQ